MANPFVWTTYSEIEEFYTANDIQAWGTGFLTTVQVTPANIPGQGIINPLKTY